LVIAIIVEGESEDRILKPALQAFVQQRIPGNTPRITMRKCKGRIPTEDKLRRMVENLLASRNPAVDAVIALTDVYTGTREFENAEDAKAKMRAWVGANDRFFPHAAQYEFEAWLLPYWDKICSVAGIKGVQPFSNPETVNHGNPPSKRLESLFGSGHKKRNYIKTVHGLKILDGQDLTVAANACPQLKAFLNTILTLCEADALE